MVDDVREYCDWQVEFGAILNGRYSHLSPESILRTLTCGAQDDNLTIKLRSIDLMGDLRCTGATGLLIMMLKDPYVTVRLHALGALGKINDPSATEAILESSSDADGNMRANALMILSETGNKRAQKIIKDATGDPDVWVRHQAKNAEAIFKEQRAIAKFKQNMRSTDAGLQAAALQSLVEINDERAIRTIAELLDSDNVDDRLLAIKYLAKLRGSCPISVLEKALKNNGPTVRAAIITALYQVMGQFDDPHIYDLIIERLFDDDESVRIEASWILLVRSMNYNISGKVADQIVIGAARALKNKNAKVREQVISMLLNLWAPGALEPLNQAIDSQDADLRGLILSIAQDRLSVAGGRKNFHFDEGGRLRYGVMSSGRETDEKRLTDHMSQLLLPEQLNPVEITGQVLDGSTVLLPIDELRHPDFRVRLRAIDALAKIGDSRAAVSITQSICDPDSRVRANAANIIKKISAQSTIAPLVDALDDSRPEVRSTALYLLGYRGNQDTVAIITEFLYDENGEVRINAMKAIARIYSR